MARTRFYIHPSATGGLLRIHRDSPMPETHLPVNMNSTSTGELQVVKADFPGLNGKTIKHAYRPVREEDFYFAGKTIKCVLIEGENTNYLDSLGKYKSAWLFSTNYGFVQLTYTKPGGEVVKMVLWPVNF